MKGFIVLTLMLAYLLPGCTSGDNELPVLGPEGHVVPAFSFTNQNGDTTGSELLEGKVFVADFFFVRCKGICPKMTTEMKRVQDTFKGNEKLKLVSFTVDPEHDSSAVLREYMEQYDADPAMWTMYTGDKKALYQLARSGFFITAVEGDGGADDFVHSERLVLVDARKKIRGYYDGTDPRSVDALIADLRKLLD